MQLRELKYQARVLRAIDGYLTELGSQKRRAELIERVAAGRPELGLEPPDYTESTWRALSESGLLPPSRSGVPFSRRVDGVGRPVPNISIKVPTGGGKTFLAASAISNVLASYLTRNTGFVLWIIPNEAIYTQTKRQLADREHPYRQILDRAAAGRVRILEKDDPLDARDIESNLCVMLLMLQSANRQTRESLKMFQDRGDVRGFFPPEGEAEAHASLLEAIPNLDAYAASSALGSFWPLVKDSLGNALRLVNPVIVMDEGHRAISPLAYETLYGFNPSFVVELTATPKDVRARAGAGARPARYANVLVEVSGVEVDSEGMIKMPVNVDSRQSTDWRRTLAVAKERIDALQRDAERYAADGGAYIRPIMLVQVERTGADQRDGSHVHALDAKDWLIRAGLDDAEIAIKTAETNELSLERNQDLLSPANRVRAIVTKQALQEGWDCAFAYVLCALAPSADMTALTQLIGRILRQPYAQKTGNAALDECYVVTHHAETGQVVQAIKAGLEEDGLADLVKQIRLEDAGAARSRQKIPRRDRFRNEEIFLPIVLISDGAECRVLDYENDVLFQLDWSRVDPKPLGAKIPKTSQHAHSQFRRISLAESGEERIVAEAGGEVSDTLQFDPAYATRMVSDIIPNPWITRVIVSRLLDALHRRDFSQAEIGEAATLIIDEFRKWLSDERDRMAEDYFRSQVANGSIQFRLRADGVNWRMPFETETLQPAGSRQLLSKTGGPLAKSLFQPLYEEDFSNRDERDVAVYLDGEAALRWWHRNVARSQYSIQGWKRDKVYPDFILALQHDGKMARLLALEMKGAHLQNPDTEYKRQLMRLMSENFQIEQTARVGELALEIQDGTTVDCELVLFTEWKTKLPQLLNTSAEP